MHQMQHPCWRNLVPFHRAQAASATRQPVTAMTHKTCTSCNKTKPVSLFRIGRCGPLRDTCKKCHTDDRERWRKQRKEGALLCWMAGSWCKGASASSQSAVRMLERAS